MNFYTAVILGFSILIPGVIAIIQFERITKAYYPFVLAIWLGCINEILSLILILKKQQTLVNNNLYALVEAVLMICFFIELRLFKNRWTPYFFIFLFFAVWIMENCVFSSIMTNSTYFKIIYCFTVVFMSINVINEIIFSTKRNILRDTTFLICIAFVIYFTYMAFIQTFFIYGITRSSNFLINIFTIMIYINLGTNLLYALALLWMPRKVKYTSLPALQSS